MTVMEISPSFERCELTRLLGGGKSHRFSHSLDAKIDKLEVRLKELMKPQLFYRTKKIEAVNNGSIRIEGGISFTSSNFSKAMKNCDEIICFIATIGNDIEEEITLLTEENYLSNAYILDSMGSVTVENMVEEFYQDMRDKYIAEGKKVTLRFSPGYCDCPIADQEKLFSCFDSFQIGVELTDSCLMLPRKSVSGIFGVLPSNMPVYNPCSECNRINCPYKRD